MRALVLLLLAVPVFGLTNPTATPIPAPTIAIPPGCQFESYSPSVVQSGFSGNYSVDHPNGDWNGGKPGRTVVWNGGDPNLEISVSQPKGLPLVYDRSVYAMSFDPPLRQGFTVTSLILRVNATQVLDWAHVYVVTCGWTVPLSDLSTCGACADRWIEPGADAVITPLSQIRAPAVVDFPLNIPKELGSPLTLSCGLLPLAPPPTTTLPSWNWLTFSPDPKLLVIRCPIVGDLPTLPDCQHCVAREPFTVEMP